MIAGTAMLVCVNDLTPRLGVDIGRVVIDGAAHPEGGDTAFFTGSTAVMLRTPEVPGAFAALARLVSIFDGRVWLVSKCGPRVQGLTRQWLAHHELTRRTGIPLDHVRFCLRRPQKADHCRELGITHFVDDKLDVHAALRGLVPHLVWFGQSSGPEWVTAAPTWARAEAAVVSRVPAR